MLASPELFKVPPMVIAPAMFAVPFVKFSKFLVIVVPAEMLAMPSLDKLFAVVSASMFSVPLLPNLSPMVVSAKMLVVPALVKLC